MLPTAEGHLPIRMSTRPREKIENNIEFFCASWRLGTSALRVFELLEIASSDDVDGHYHQR